MMQRCLAMTERPHRGHVIGAYCVGGDWACAHGDFAGLRHVVEQLCILEGAPLHDELRVIADACTADPDLAATRWMLIRPRLARDA